jgi:hypothetical protein
MMPPRLLQASTPVEHALWEARPTRRRTGNTRHPGRSVEYRTMFLFYGDESWYSGEQFGAQQPVLVVAASC